MDAQPDIARVAALFADRARSRIVLYLIDGRAQPAGQIAEAAGVAASTASAHLARLVAEGVLGVEQRGRQRYYRISDPRVVTVVEALLPLTQTTSPIGLTANNRMRRLRLARVCYDHAAGQLGTTLLTGLLRTGALIRTDGLSGIDLAPNNVLSGRVPDAPYAIGPHAEHVLGALNISLDTPRPTKRPLIRACADWTENRHHLAGSLGAILLEALMSRGWVERTSYPRELAVKAPGSIAQWLTP